MERIKVYKGKKGLAKFFVIFGSIFFILAVLILIKSSTDGFDFHFPSGEWNSILFIFQGLLFILMGSSYLNSTKYFIEWDDNELRFILPGNKSIETIKINEIKSVSIKLFEIDLELTNGSKKINLENLEFEDIKKVKTKFEKIGMGAR